MMKAIIVFFSCFLTASVFAATTCPQASPTNSPGFCSTFKSSAECHCTSKGMPKGMCADMNLLYNRMISMFGTLERACQFQHDTSTQNCIDDWNCYRVGGNDSQGQACSATGHACQ